LPVLPTHSPPPALTRWLALLLAVQLVGVGYVVWFFITEGYLPSPFVYDKADTFMDFFHPLYWAGDEGRYTVWQSVYPPLNFLLLKAIHHLILGGNQFSDGFAIRDAYPGLAFLILAIALISAFIAIRIGPFRTLARRDQILLFLFFILSPPFLFAIERGNLIVLALPLLALVFTRCGLTRMIAIAVLINLKPYFALLTLVYVAQHRLDEFILTSLMAASLFMVTGLLIDANFLLFFTNLTGFSQSETVFSGREVLAMPSSISAFSYVAEIAMMKEMPLSDIGELAVALAKVLNWINHAAMAFLAASIFLGGKNVPSYLALLGTILLITNVSVKTGGYSLIFLIFVIGLFASYALNKTYATLTFLIFSPLDLISLIKENRPLQFIYLTQQFLPIENSLGLGSIARPCLDFLLAALSVWTVSKYRSLSVASAKVL
jgi:hypothetical protein